MIPRLLSDTISLSPNFLRDMLIVGIRTGGFSLLLLSNWMVMCECDVSPTQVELASFGRPGSSGTVDSL